MIYTILFLILFLCANPEIQNLFASFLGQEKPNVFSGFCLAFLCCLLIIIIINFGKNSGKDPKKNKEDFLFKVSEFNPRCNGMYNGKPTTFQYNQIGCNYNQPVGYNPDIITSNQKSIRPYCDEEKNPPLGMHSNKDSELYGNEYKI
jgi:hypothetical protein